MTTNGEWLFSKPFDEQVAWMHEEHQDGTLDGDTDALNATIAELERKLRISWEYECKFQDERDNLQGALDIAVQNESKLEAERDKLKADLEAAYAKSRSLRQHISQMQNGRNEWHVKAVRLEKQLEVTNKRCEEYRKKFGKCLDYADAIHALMDDEGMA